MNKNEIDKFLKLAKQVAKEAECGAVLTKDGNLVNAFSNIDDEYAYMTCIKNGVGDTLFLTHGVSASNAKEIAKAGIKQVYFIDELGIGVGTQLLKVLGVKVLQVDYD